MLELQWLPDFHAAEMRGHTQPAEQGSPKPKGDAAPKSERQPDEQFRKALHGATKALVNGTGGFIKEAVKLPCGHVQDLFEVRQMYQRQKGNLKRAQNSSGAAGLRASAKQSYMCPSCPSDRRKDIGHAPGELPLDVDINQFVKAFTSKIDGPVRMASAQDLEDLKSHLRSKHITIPKLPFATAQATPEMAAYNCAVGETLAKSGNLVEAEAWFAAAVTAEPDVQLYNRNMYVCLTKLLKHADAEPFFAKAGLAPTQTTRNPMHDGIDLLLAGRYAEALPMFRQALASEPHDGPGAPMLQSLIGGCLSVVAGAEASLSSFISAMNLRPDNAKFRRDVGYTLYKMGRYTEAVSHLEQACAQDPNNARFAYELGWCQRKAGNSDQAEYHLSRATRLDSLNPHYAHDLGMFFFLKKRYAAAKPNLENAVVNGADVQQYAADLAQCLRKIDKKSMGRMQRIFSKLK